jgi:competence protein ComEC
MNFKPYPFLRYLILLMSGIILNEYILISPFWLAAFLAAVFFGFIIAFLRKNHMVVKACLFSGILILGWWIARINNESLSQEHFVNQGEFSDYIVCVNSATESKPKTYKCIAEVRAIRIKGKWKRANGQTLVYFARTARTIPVFGGLFIIRGHPRLIEGPKNAFEFDYRQYQKRKNIFTHHFLREGDFKYVGKKTFHPIFEWAHYLNQYSDVYFRKHLETSREIGVAEALIAGMRSELDNEIINAYSVSGAIHVLSVSGMHVGILFLVLNWLAGLFSRQSNKKPFPTLVLIILLWIYALYTGLSPSACRATLMFSLIQLGYALKRETNNYNIIAFSAFILLLVNPSWLFDVGFQLSYLAVLGIIMLYSPLRDTVEIKNRALRWLWEISVVSFVAQLFTFPLSLYYFHQFPTYFLFSNPVVAILATPLLPLGLLFVILSPVPYLAVWLGWLLNHLIKLLNDFIVFTTGLPYASLNGFSLTVPELILLYVLIGCCVLFFVRSDIRALRVAAVSMVLLGSMKLASVYRQNKQQELTFHYIPNSSGLSIIQSREAKFIAPDSVLGDQMVYQFHLKNYYDHSGVNRLNKKRLGRKGSCLLGNGLKLLWITKGLPLDKQLDAPFLLISDNAITDLTPLRHFKGRIILDGSNRKWVCDKLKEEAKSFRVDLISLYDRGSVTFTLNSKEFQN